MITAHDLNDPASALISHYLPRFQTAPRPDPANGRLDRLGSTSSADRDAPDGNPKNAMNVTEAGAFTTVCSNLLALASDRRAGDALRRRPPGRRCRSTLSSSDSIATGRLAS